MIATLLAAILTVTLVASAQASQPTQEVERENFEVYLCPVHRDEQATKPGECPLCQRQLVRRILVPSYSCPMHAHIDEEESGQCPICNMNLVSTVRELQFYCEDHPETVSSTREQCPDGSPMSMRTIAMPHGDHNPKHGGMLFMAPNGFHHIEGTFDDAREFRLYLYNDFTKPIDARDFEARIGDVALAPGPGGAYLKASLGESESDSAEVVLHVSFPGSHEEESRFDFIFAGTADVDGAASTSVLPEFRIPETSEEIFGEIMQRDERVRDLIVRGVWPDLYIPALEAKDLVLALSEKEGARVRLPAKKLVRAAWLLDNYGDIGNRLGVEAAYGLFEEAIRDLEAAHAR